MIIKCPLSLQGSPYDITSPTDSVIGADFQVSLNSEVWSSTNFENLEKWIWTTISEHQPALNNQFRTSTNSEQPTLNNQLWTSSNSEQSTLNNNSEYQLWTLFPGFECGGAGKAEGGMEGRVEVCCLKNIQVIIFVGILIFWYSDILIFWYSDILVL